MAAKFENLSIYRFQAALVKYGVGKVDLFQTNDLSEKKDIANVTNTLYALGREVSPNSHTGPKSIKNSTN